MARKAEQASNLPSADVTVLGAGIIGICSALALQERGLSVEVVDRGEPGQATSFGNAGIVSPWSCVPQSLPGIWKSVPRWLLDPQGPLRVRASELPRLLPWVTSFFANTRLKKVHEISKAMEMLMQGNIAAYRRHLKGTGREDLLQDCWLISVFRGKARPDLTDLVWRLRIDKGAPVALVACDELREIEPELSPEFGQAVVVKDQARALAPGEICRVLAEKARRQGALFIKCDVKGLRPRDGGGIDLETDLGPIKTNRLVLCGGVWSAELLRPLGIKLPLVSERGYHMEFTEPEVRLNHSIMDVAGKFIVSSMEGGVRSAGTSEFAGVNAPPNFKRADILVPMSKRLIPRLNTRQCRRWVGARPSFPDNLPVVGVMPGFPSLYGAFGHSHYGLGMAPATGRIVAETIMGSLSNADRSSVSVERFL